MTTGLSHVSGRLWLSGNNGSDLGAESVSLLEAIAQHGSIAGAAKALGISYRSAWDAVDRVSNLTDTPLLERRAGGAHGGETRLTAHGQTLVSTFRRMENEYRRFLAEMSRQIDNLDRLEQLMRRLAMRTSARNQLLGTVIETRLGPVNAEVTLALNRHDRLVATITRESLETMNLREGRDAWALIKASSVILAAADENLRTSARNRLCGRISRIHSGPVNSEVVVELDGDTHIAAIITRESERELDLREGRRVYALVKASHIILGIG